MKNCVQLGVYIICMAGLAVHSGCGNSSRSEGLAQEPAQVSDQPAESGDDPMVSVDTLFDAPEDFAIQRIDTEEYPIPVYAKYLQGVKICLDPGHGGNASKRGYKRGPTGVREAEMNLRVAKYLRDFLVHSGAEVLLTREEDVKLSLKERAELANEWGADLFLSCHHNAIGKPAVNRTTVWYHLDVDYRPANLDLARYIFQGLQDGIALPQITGVPLKSDQLMYPNGFGVLRPVKMTAALTETSFFTNPEEEQRLRDPNYNLLEAYSLYLGFAKYAFSGLPKVELVEPVDGMLSAGQPVVLEFKLDDGLRKRKAWGSERQMILSSSIEVQIDGQVYEHEFFNDGYKLTVELPDGLPAGKHNVNVQFQNKYKNSVLNPIVELTVE